MPRQEDNISKRIRRSSYAVYLGYLVFAVIIIVKLISLQSYEPKPWLKKHLKASSHRESIRPRRGSILSHDGRILAMSLPEYQIYMDPTVLKESFDDLKASKDTAKQRRGKEGEENWRAKARIMADGLAMHFKDKSGDQYFKSIISARTSGVKYLKLGRKISHSTLNELKKLPFIGESPYKGGIRFDTLDIRQYPYGSLARKTIGKVNNNYEKNSHVGLEGKYDHYLHGEDGYRWMKEIDLHEMIQDYDSTWSPAKNGLNLRTTLDIDLQDMADSALRANMVLNPLIYEGCLVVMEVETGAIRAMSNLIRDNKSKKYYESYNMAINDAREPGSVFKTTTLMTLLEDGKVRIDDRIPCNGGKLPDFSTPDNYITSYIKRTGKDSITIRHCLEISSNYAFRYLALKYYKDKPKNMIGKLYQYKLGDEALEFDINGFTTPFIPTPEDKEHWYKTSLPQMAIGYEVRETPLHILTFYNAIANDGKMMAPYLVESLEDGNEVVIKKGKRELNASICSKKTSDILKDALRGVVTNPHGTGHRTMGSVPVPVAGKTGTARMVLPQEYTKGKIDAWTDAQGRTPYRATFVCFFPADKPKYSAICTMCTDPMPKSTAVYGSQNPAWAIRDLIYKMYYFDSENGEIMEKTGTMPDMSAPALPETQEGCAPDVRGLGLNDAVFRIENAGYTCIWHGTGHVSSQAPPAGSKLEKGRTIELELK